MSEQSVFGIPCSLCNCESMCGRFGAHRPECPWQQKWERLTAEEVEGER